MYVCVCLCVRACVYLNHTIEPFIMNIVLLPTHHILLVTRDVGYVLCISYLLQVVEHLIS